jgi:hypothetical protein
MPSAAWTTKRIRPPAASTRTASGSDRDRSEYSMPYWLITAPKWPGGKGSASTGTPPRKVIAA